MTVTIRLSDELCNAKFGSTKLLTMLKGMGAEVVDTGIELIEETIPTDVEEVWTYWLQKLGPHFVREPSRLPKRLQIIRARLRRWSIDDLKQVIDFVSLSPFHLGKNDANKKYIDLHHIMGNDLKVEQKLEQKTPQNADKIKSLRLTLRALGDSLRHGTADLQCKSRFEQLLRELKNLNGEVYQWRDDTFKIG